MEMERGSDGYGGGRERDDGESDGVMDGSYGDGALLSGRLGLGSAHDA